MEVGDGESEGVTSQLWLVRFYLTTHELDYSARFRATESLNFYPLHAGRRLFHQFQLVRRTPATRTCHYFRPPCAKCPKSPCPFWDEQDLVRRPPSRQAHPSLHTDPFDPPKTLLPPLAAPSQPADRPSWPQLAQGQCGSVRQLQISSAREAGVLTLYPLRSPTHPLLARPVGPKAAIRRSRRLRSHVGASGHKIQCERSSLPPRLRTLSLAC